MKKKSPNQSFSIFGVLCSLVGHQYLITNKITNHINEYRCSQCGKEVTDGTSGDLELLTFKNKKVNESLALFFKKKMRRITTH